MGAPLFRPHRHLPASSPLRGLAPPTCGHHRGTGPRGHHSSDPRQSCSHAEGRADMTTPVGEPHYFHRRSHRDLAERVLPDRHVLDKATPKRVRAEVRRPGRLGNRRDDTRPEFPCLGAEGWPGRADRRSAWERQQLLQPRPVLRRAVEGHATADPPGTGGRCAQRGERGQCVVRGSNTGPAQVISREEAVDALPATRVLRTHVGGMVMPARGRYCVHDVSKACPRRETCRSQIGSTWVARGTARPLPW